jgi:hypothetical protein
MFFYSDFYLDRNEEEIKKIFLNLIKHKIINNIQSKYISTCYPKNSRHHVKESQKIEYIDLDKLNKNLNRINYVIDNNFLRNNPDDVAKNIFDAMGYTASSIKVKDAYRSEKSFNLYKSLTDSEKEKILDLNYLDYQIYDQKNNISFEIK